MLVEEETEGVNSTLAVFSSTQITDDGSPMNCRGQVVAAQVPCREVTLEVTQAPAGIFATAVKIDLGAPSGSAPFSDGFYYVRSMDFVTAGTFAGQYEYVPAAGSRYRLYDLGSGGIGLELDVSGGLYVATYELASALAQGWGARGINIQDQATLTLNQVSSTWPATAPAPASVTLYANQRDAAMVATNYATWVGLAFRQSWWRWYDATTFDPDGSSAFQIGYRIDRSGIDIEIGNLTDRVVTNSGPGNNGGVLALRQGSNRAFLTGITPAITTSGNWWHNDYPVTNWSSLSWSKFGVDANGNNTEQAFTPDLTNGADPITFGLLLNAGTVAVNEYVNITARPDQFCFRRRDL